MPRAVCEPCGGGACGGWRPITYVHTFHPIVVVVVVAVVVVVVVVYVVCVLLSFMLLRCW